MIRVAAWVLALAALVLSCVGIATAWDEPSSRWSSLATICVVAALVLLSIVRRRKT